MRRLLAYPQRGGQIADVDFVCTRDDIQMG
jgi:hypothetical protein